MSLRLSPHNLPFKIFFFLNSNFFPFYSSRSATIRQLKNDLPFPVPFIECLQTLHILVQCLSLQRVSTKLELLCQKKKFSQCLKNDNIFKKFKSSNQDFFWLCIRKCSLCLSMFHSTTLTKYAYCICEKISNKENI